MTQKVDNINDARTVKDGEDDGESQARVEERRAEKIARKKASQARKLAYEKSKNNMVRPHLSSSSFMAAAWFQTNCKDGKQRAIALRDLSLDAQHEFSAYRRFASLNPW